jgi:hypothetical protein
MVDEIATRRNAGVLAEDRVWVRPGREPVPHGNANYDAIVGVICVALGVVCIRALISDAGAGGAASAAVERRTRASRTEAEALTGLLSSGGVSGGRRRPGDGVDEVEHRDQQRRRERKTRDDVAVADA